ncbi:MAG: GGDEF domain-containing protein [Deltaproteobacteria bacterium]|jgi:diguanylate cyclase (GGDEF)-like protein|nr:GGDEF domain-containing protein [Deltaproteobacteria bacterium]
MHEKKTALLSDAPARKDAEDRRGGDVADEALALRFLCSMEFALLRRLKPMFYELYGLAPDFYSKFFPPEPDGAPCRAPWEHSSMLEFFLLDAEEFFDRSPKPGDKVNSGIWLESNDKTGDELPLVAKAVQLHSDQLITIQVIQEEYAERVRILRKARMELVERRKIFNALNSFKKKALYDAMTKLYNRGSFMEILQDQVEKYGAYTPAMALFMIDVDNFKKVNDTLGHLVGDSVLVQVSEILINSLRKNDFPARYGGDEFAVVAPDTNAEQSSKLAEKLRHRIQAHNFNTGEIPVTISVGCTTYRTGESIQNFIRRADKALYEAKQLGRNVACFRDPWLIDDEELSPAAPVERGA